MDSKSNSFDLDDFLGEDEVNLNDMNDTNMESLDLEEMTEVPEDFTNTETEEAFTIDGDVVESTRAKNKEETFKTYEDTMYRRQNPLLERDLSDNYRLNPNSNIEEITKNKDVIVIDKSSPQRNTTKKSAPRKKFKEPKKEIKTHKMRLENVHRNRQVPKNIKNAQVIHQIDTDSLRYKFINKFSERSDLNTVTMYAKMYENKIKYGVKYDPRAEKDLRNFMTL